MNSIHNIPYKDIITVIDDFYDEPDIIRGEAMSLDYREPFVPEIQSTEKVISQRGAFAKRADIPEKTKRLSIKKLNPILHDIDENIHMQYRLSSIDCVKRQICHVDQTALAAILYLTLPEHCQGGTSFYRHKRTGAIHSLGDREVNYN